MRPTSGIDLAGKRVLVAGLGKSGRSAIRFCQAQGAVACLSDSGPATSEASAWLDGIGVKYEFDGHRDRFCHAVDLILLSPGVPHDLPVWERAKDKAIPVIGELALAPRYLRTPVIAVTGTNGKTTVTTLTGDLLKGAGKKVFVGGNIGTPLTDYLMTEQTAEWLVLEVSSFQLDAAGDFRPEIGLLLNISPDHLDRYPSYEDYALAKFKLFAHQRMNDVSIVNRDDQDARRLFAEAKSIRPGWEPRRCLSFGALRQPGEDGAEIREETVRLTGGWLSGPDEIYDLRGTRLASSPNRENAAAALLAARATGCQPEGLRLGLAGFRPLAHRMTEVAEVGGVRYIDDSKATNIGAVVAALAALPGPVVLIAGGRDKGGEYRLLADQVRAKVKAMLLIGEARERMALAFQGLTQVELLDSLPQAVAKAHELANPGEVVLLSPACSSFDMFSGYAERGEVFARLVMGLKA
ncbi:MAG: UDP-N-acetylmuramoyl-L-alanine--D-glutamate ligase [Desulfobacteraceae bacterium]|nr:UDP-N-acetylmuramoyl-L-alanine--D-glutamate ligase [Desulfobacteraceae bacterium]